MITSDPQTLAPPAGLTAQDLLIGATGSTVGRVAVGTDGQQLVVRSDGTLGYVNTLIYAKAWYAKGDNATDDTAALQSAINAAYASYVANGGGAIVWLDAGTYRISSPLTVPRNVTICGSHSTRWVYDVGNPCTIKPFSTFVGAAAILMQDETTGAYNPTTIATVAYTQQGGQVLRDFVLDGSAYTATQLDGIQAQGQVPSVLMDNVQARYFSGNGFRNVTETESTVLQFARGWRLIGCVAASNTLAGFSLNNLTDSNLVDCWANSNGGDGITWTTFGECMITMCHSVFNGGNGLTLAGQSGGINVVSFNTDRNQQHGVSVNCAGYFPVVFGTLALRRDGANAEAGGGGYAGLFVNSSTTAPVIVGTIVTSIGLDDGATSGNPSPQYGVSAANTSSVLIAAGYLWGVTAAVNSSSYTAPTIGPAVVQASGGTGVYGSGPASVLGSGVANSASVPGTPVQGATPLVGTPYYNRKQIAAINNNGTTTVYTITHNLGTSNVQVSGRSGTTELTSANFTWAPASGSTVTITYPSAPVAGTVHYFTILG